MFDLIEMVHRGDIDYTIVDSNVYDINRNLFPEALVAFELSGPQELAWAFAKSTDSSLYDAAQRFFAEYEGSGRLADIRDSYYGNNEVVDRTSALVLSQRIEKRLPRLRQHLEAAAREQNLEWELLAAVSYQESHWDPRAVSPTGVRGLMMLTTPTAREMGVRDRTDPKQSIFGGARYLTALQDYIPEQVQGDDRLWMTLAAYNLGPGHLKDARVLTQRRGGNPDSWEDVKATLPLLSNRQYYRNARHGYARGREAVKYVENIRSFYTVLVWHSQMEARRVALASTQQQTAPAADPAFPPLSLNDSGQRRLSRL
jgi:membrane-bound lytic murein transglycosylase F